MNKYDRIKNKIFSEKSGNLFFKTGVFFLLSAPGLAVLLFLISSTISLKKIGKSFLKDKLNYLLIITSFLMILSSIIKLNPINYPYKEWNPLLSWVGLANWLPLFFCYWGFQPYLRTNESRRKVSLILIYGTFPLIATGLLQYFFQVYGPFDIFNGFIIWFSKPINIDEGLTGLFNNPNYAGAWLSIIFPFTLVVFQESNVNPKKFFSLLVLFIFGYVTFLTFSRSAWINMGLTFLLIMGKSYIFIIIAIFTTIFSLGIGCIYGFESISFNGILERILSAKFCPNFTEIDFSSSHRIIIWKNAFDLIRLKPFLGYGASSFSTLYLLKSGRITTHAHNLLLEISINYGVISALLLLIFISFLIYKSFPRIFQREKGLINNYDKAWWAAAFTMLLSHLYDNQYYDLRISIACWILFAGIRNIILENNIKKTKLY